MNCETKCDKDNQICFWCQLDGKFRIKFKLKHHKENQRRIFLSKMIQPNKYKQSV